MSIPGFRQYNTRAMRQGDAARVQSIVRLISVEKAFRNGLVDSCVKQVSQGIDEPAQIAHPGVGCPRLGTPQKSKRGDKERIHHIIETVDEKEKSLNYLSVKALQSGKSRRQIWDGGLAV